MSANMDGDISKCPVVGIHRHTAAGALTNDDWWPEQLNLKLLAQHSERVNPLDPGFNYAEAFKTLDLDAVKADLTASRSSVLNASA